MKISGRHGTGCGSHAAGGGSQPPGVRLFLSFSLSTPPPRMCLLLLSAAVAGLLCKRGVAQQQVGRLLKEPAMQQIVLVLLCEATGRDAAGFVGARTCLGSTPERLCSSFRPRSAADAGAGAAAAAGTAAAAAAQLRDAAAAHAGRHHRLVHLPGAVRS